MTAAKLVEKILKKIPVNKDDFDKINPEEMKGLNYVDKTTLVSHPFNRNPELLKAALNDPEITKGYIYRHLLKLYYAKKLSNEFIKELGMSSEKEFLEKAWNIMWTFCIKEPKVFEAVSRKIKSPGHEYTAA